MSSSAPGTDRYLCPVIDCTWHHDVPLMEVPPSSPAVWIDCLGLLTTHATGIDRIVAGHLNAHPVADFARTIAKLQTEVHRLRGDVERETGRTVVREQQAAEWRTALAQFRTGPTPTDHRPLGRSACCGEAIGSRGWCLHCTSDAWMAWLANDQLGGGDMPAG